VSNGPSESENEKQLHSFHSCAIIHPSFKVVVVAGLGVGSVETEADVFVQTSESYFELLVLIKGEEETLLQVQGNVFSGPLRREASD